MTPKLPSVAVEVLGRERDRLRREMRDARDYYRSLPPEDQARLEALHYRSQESRIKALAEVKAAISEISPHA